MPMTNAERRAVNKSVFEWNTHIKPIGPLTPAALFGISVEALMDLVPADHDMIFDKESSSVTAEDHAAHVRSFVKRAAVGIVAAKGAILLTLPNAHVEVSFNTLDYTIYPFLVRVRPDCRKQQRGNHADLNPMDAT